MKRVFLIALLTVAGLAGTPTKAAADITFFVGLSPNPTVRTVKGVSAGMTMLIFGFEFDYSVTSENTVAHSAGLQTGMFNFIVQTPTTHQLYVTVGAGLYRETLDAIRVTNYGTNIGGGVKFQLFGPLHVRVDYRVFALHGNARTTRPQRLYVGANIPF
jgi:hypothetical protein